MAALCFLIHGIGSQPQDYSDPLQHGVHRALERTISERAKSDRNWDNVEATSLVDFHALFWANIGTNDQANLYRKLYPEYFGATSWLRRASQTLFRFAPARDLSVNLLGDVFAYLGRFQEEIRRAVFDQLANALEKAITSGEPFSVILVGHSLGTVILHDLISGFIRHRYAGFDALAKRTSVFTMGSPVSLFTLVTDGAKPSQFRSWVNFLHQRDPIAFPMRRLFPTVEDVSLVKRSFNPLKLHGSYWTHQSVHQRIAAEILNHFEQGIGIAAAPGPMGEVPAEIFRSVEGDLAVAGYSQFYDDFTKVPFADLISGAREIDVCNVYGGHWLQGHAQYFAKALRRPETTIRFCTLATDSPALAGFSYHFTDFGEEEICRRIEAGTKELRQALELAQRTPPTGRLRIFRMKNIVNHSFYRFDDLILWAPRPLASSKIAATPIPCFAFRRTAAEGGLYHWLQRDFNELIGSARDCTLHFDSAAEGAV
jgi:hypothetical protein